MTLCLARSAPRALAAALVAALPLIAAFSPSASDVRGTDGPSGPAAYYLVGGDAQSLSPVAIEVAQEGKRFLPDLAAVPVGSTVAFPNRDDLTHNVYSPEGPLGFVDLGSAEKTLGDGSNLLQKTIPQEGAVHIACAIHPIMTGIVFVVPSRYATVSRDGTYAFSNVPAGTYDLMVMDAKGGTSKLKTLTVQ